MFTMFATDLDGTMLGDERSLAELNGLLRPLIDSGSLKLVYVTGRSVDSYKQSKDLPLLLQPAALITAVGTEIYINDERISNWPNITYWDGTFVESILSKYTQLEKQPTTEQRDFKRCYYYSGDPQLIDQIHQELGPDYHVVYSSNAYLDILPNGINKATAIRLLCDLWKVPTNDVITCGDSENDLPMLKAFKAVIVGNATEKLLSEFVDENDGKYFARNKFAGGVTEGLRHYGILS